MSSGFSGSHCAGVQTIKQSSHDAIDFVIYNPKLSYRDNLRLTYGAQLVAPTDSRCVLVNNFGEMNDLGNGIDIEWNEDGYYWRLHFWHTCYNQLKLGEVAKEGTIVGLMGNTGFVNPKPTPTEPYNGTHCHMRFSRYEKDAWGGNINIVSLDPTLYFDVINPYQGDDSSLAVDVPPLKWAWNKLGITSVLEKLIYMINNIFNG